MSKHHIKGILLIIINLCIFSFINLQPAKAYSEYEVDYVFKSAKGITIEKTVFKIDDYENYYFQDYVYKDREGVRVKTYKLYEKDTDEPCNIGRIDGSIVIFNDDIYLIESGICLVNQFYYIGKGEDNCDYWIYFGKDGKMVKNATIYDSFKLDKNGLFNYNQSNLYKRLTKAGYSPNRYDITDILNKNKCSELGKWVKIKDYVPSKPLFSVDGYFEKDKNQLRFWANLVQKNIALVPSSSVLNYYKRLEGYVYKQDETYDWRTLVLAENEYLKDILIEIDGAYYYFNENGYAEKNKWVYVDYEYYYFDSNGKRLTNDWMSKDGELYRLDENGSIMTKCWVEDNGRHLYLSYEWYNILWGKRKGI